MTDIHDTRIRDCRGGATVTVEATTVNVGVFDYPGDEPGDPRVAFDIIDVITTGYDFQTDRYIENLVLQLDPAGAVTLAHRLIAIATPLLPEGDME